MFINQHMFLDKNDIHVMQSLVLLGLHQNKGLDARLPKYIRRRKKSGKMHVTFFQMPTFHGGKFLCNKTPSNYIVKIGFLRIPKKVI